MENAHYLLLMDSEMINISIDPHNFALLCFIGSVVATRTAVLRDIADFISLPFPQSRSEANLQDVWKDTSHHSSASNLNGSRHRTPSPRRLNQGVELAKGFEKGDMSGFTPLVKRLTKPGARDGVPLVVGVAGGTGSGKTTLARAILRGLEEQQHEVSGYDNEEHDGSPPVTYISHDSYYRDLGHLPMGEREKSNFDHPDSLETDLLVEHIRDLKDGRTVNVPKYDYSTHTRVVGKDATTLALPAPVILVEGILILSHPELVSLLDIKIFVDTEDDVRLIRRIQRDTVERGRDVEGIINQYLKTVRPMHVAYVEPSRLHADIIIPMGLNQVALELVVSRLRDRLEGRQCTVAAEENHA